MHSIINNLLNNLEKKMFNMKLQQCNSHNSPQEGAQI